MERPFPKLRRLLERGALALFVAGALAASTAAPVQAQAEGPGRGPWSVGFQSSWPVYGLSVRYDMSDKLTAQAVAGAAASLVSLSVRGNYRFEEAEKYALFGYGAVGFWTWNGGTAFANENSIAVGAGGGVELDWPAIIGDSEFPPLYSTVELGFGVAPGFTNYSFSAFSFGVSLHYRL